MKSKIMVPILLALLVGTVWSQTTVSIDHQTTYQHITGIGAFGKLSEFRALEDQYDDIAYEGGFSIIRHEISPYCKLSADDEFNVDAQVFGGPTTRANFMNIKGLADRGLTTFIATVWSPPAYMKSNNSTRDGGYLLPEMYDDFAQYLITYIEQCREISGVELYAVSLQNELEWAHPFNSCVYQPDQMRDLIKVVKPLFEAADLQTKIFFPEHMADLGRNARYIDAVLNDPVAREAADIVAVHGYLLDGASPDSPDAQNWQVLFGKGDAYGMPLWMTEISGYHWYDWADAMELAKGMYTAFKHGKISAWVWWALDDPHKPNLEDERYTLWYDGVPTRLFDVHRNFSRYIRPGAVQIGAQSNATDLLATAFYHPQDEHTTVVLINQSSSSRSVTLTGAGLPSLMDVYVTTESGGMVAQAPMSGSSVELPGSSITTLTNNRDDLRSQAPSRRSAGARAANARLAALADGKLMAQSSGHAATVTVFNLNGKVLSRKVLNGTQPSLIPLSRGIYVARLEQAGSTATLTRQIVVP